MEVQHIICAGLDVHKKTVVACARQARGRKSEYETKTFGTATKELVKVFDWLAEHGCSHVGMESTGVFWKPVWRVLEGGGVGVVLMSFETEN